MRDILYQLLHMAEKFPDHSFISQFFSFPPISGYFRYFCKIRSNKRFVAENVEWYF